MSITDTESLPPPLLATYTWVPSGVIATPDGLFPRPVIGLPVTVLVAVSITTTVPLPSPAT